LSGRTLHAVDASGTVRDVSLLDYGYGLLADERAVFVKLAGQGVVELDEQTKAQTSFPDADVITLTQDADFLYWVESGRVLRQSKTSGAPAEQGPSLGTRRATSVAIDGTDVYVLSDAGPLHATFDPARMFEAVPVGAVAAPGGQGPLVAGGHRLFF